MRKLTARPHHVGSPYDKENAEWILAKFKDWGFDAKIETFNVLFPTPQGVSSNYWSPQNLPLSFRSLSWMSILRLVRLANNFPPTTPTQS